MSPWKTIDNSFFHICFNNVSKIYRLGILYKGILYKITFNFTLDKYHLIDDGKYPNEHIKFIKESK